MPNSTEEWLARRETLNVLELMGDGEGEFNGRVVQLGLWLVPESGGTYKSVAQFSQALHGIVYSLTFRDSLERLSPAEQEEQYCTHVFIGDGTLEKKYSIPAAAEVRKLKQDFRTADLLICHCYWRWGAYAIWRYGRKAGVPYWVIGHGGLDPYVWTYRWWIKKIWFEAFGRRILRDAAYIVCATRREMEKILLLEPGCRCVVVNWPIEQPPEVGGDKCSLRRKFGLEYDSRLLLCLGRLHPMKRIVELIEVFCRSQLNRTKLVIVGPGTPEYQGEVIGAKRKWDSAGGVIIRDAVYGAEKFELLKAVDGFVSNSARENFGLAAAEAMASGIPVILSAGNDLVYELDGVPCGWLLHTPDDAAMASALRAFDEASQIELLRRGMVAKKWAEEFLSFALFKKRINQLARSTKERHTGRQG